eukprot:1752372-Rhodomonas_salina.2
MRVLGRTRSNGTCPHPHGSLRDRHPLAWVQGARSRGLWVSACARDTLSADAPQHETAQHEETAWRGGLPCSFRGRRTRGRPGKHPAKPAPDTTLPDLSRTWTTHGALLPACVGKDSDSGYLRRVHLKTEEGVTGWRREVSLDVEKGMAGTGVGEGR